MFRIAFLVSFFIATLFGIEVEIKKDTNISVTSQEVQALKYYISKTLNFHLTNEGAKRLAKENKMFANQYIKEYGLSDEDKGYIRTCVEKYLAERFIQKKQRELPINREILLSYYKDHRSQYKKPDLVDAVLFWFDDADKAIRFYQKSKEVKKYEDLVRMAQEMGARIEDMGLRDVRGFRSPTKELLQKYKKSGYALPPVIVSPESASVLYVKEYKHQKGFQSFDEALPEVKRNFYKQAFIKMRDKLLREYGLRDDK